MKNKITRKFTNKDAIDCGIKENIILQLQERNKAVGVFTETDYCFGTFNMSEDHIGLYNQIENIIGGCRFYFAVLNKILKSKLIYLEKKTLFHLNLN